MPDQNPTSQSSTPQDQPTPTPVLLPEHHSHKFIWGILIATAVVLSGLGATAAWYVYFTPQPEPAPAVVEEVVDDMSDWLTYSSNELNLTFSYPKDWSSFTEQSWDNGNDPNAAVFGQTVIIQPENDLQNIKITCISEHFGASRGANISNFHGYSIIDGTYYAILTPSKPITDFPFTPKEIITSPDTKVAMIQGSDQLLGAFGNENTLVGLFNLPKNTKYLGCSVVASQISVNTFKKILSTIAFTDPTAYWQTYTNEDFQFSIKYPNSWSLKVDNSLNTPESTSFLLTPTSNNDDYIRISPSGTRDSGVNNIKRTLATIGSTPAEFIKISYPVETLEECYYRLLQGPDSWAIGDSNTVAYENINAGCDISDEEQQILSTFQFLDATKRYSVEEFQNPDFPPHYFDTSLVRSDNTVIIPSLRQATGVFLDGFSLPQQGDQLFFRSISPGTDNASGNIYTYNLKTKAIKQLKILNTLYSGWGKAVVHPNGTTLAFVRDNYFDGGALGLDQLLYIFDLSTDTVIDNIKLTGQETFNEGYGALSSEYNIRWINDNTLAYDVFKNATSSEPKQLLRTDRYDLSN